MIFVSVPVSTTVAVPEPVTVTPPAPVAVSVPDATLSVTLILPLAASRSLIERPVSATFVSSLVAQPEAGSVLTGASLTAVTATVVTAVLEASAPSLTVTLIVRPVTVPPRVGLSEVEE